MVSVTSWVTVPVTPGVTVKVAVLIDEAFIASLKVAVMTALEHTPAEPLAGVSETTVGGGLHPEEARVELHTKALATPLPNRYIPPVVSVAVADLLRARGPGG